MGAQIWTVRTPDGGATGLEFARSRIAPTTSVLLHAAPSVIDVEVFDEDSKPLAASVSLRSTDETPMTRLTLDGAHLRREEIWPDDGDLGRVVLLGGGEAGVLRSWWNADDHSEWRWEVEFSNHR
jgi:hypothetical protein